MLIMPLMSLALAVVLYGASRTFTADVARRDARLAMAAKAD
jgi:hypothetical protein